MLCILAWKHVFKCYFKYVRKKCSITISLDHNIDLCAFWCLIKTAYLSWWFTLHIAESPNFNVVWNKIQRKMMRMRLKERRMQTKDPIPTLKATQAARRAKSVPYVWTNSAAKTLAPPRPVITSSVWNVSWNGPRLALTKCFTNLTSKKTKTVQAYIFSITSGP